MLRLWSGAIKDLLASSPGKSIALATIPRSTPPPADGRPSGSKPAGEPVTGGPGPRASLQAVKTSRYHWRLGSPLAEGKIPIGFFGPHAAGVGEGHGAGSPPEMALLLSGAFSEDVVRDFLEIIYPAGTFAPFFKFGMANVMAVTRLAFALRAPGVLTRCEDLVAEKLDLARGHVLGSDHYLLPWLEVCDAIGCVRRPSSLLVGRPSLSG